MFEILVQILFETIAAALYYLFRFVFYYLGYFIAQIFGIKNYDIKVKRLSVKIRRFNQRELRNREAFLGFLLMVVLFYITLYIIKFFRN